MSRNTIPNTNTYIALVIDSWHCLRLRLPSIYNKSSRPVTWLHKHNSRCREKKLIISKSCSMPRMPSTKYLLPHWDLIRARTILRMLLLHLAWTRREQSLTWLAVATSIWKLILNLPLIHALLNFFQFDVLVFIGYKPPVVPYMVYHLPCQSSHPQAHMPIQICSPLPTYCHVPTLIFSPPSCHHIPTLILPFHPMFREFFLLHLQ